MIGDVAEKHEDFFTWTKQRVVTDFIRCSVDVSTYLPQDEMIFSGCRRAYEPFEHVQSDVGQRSRLDHFSNAHGPHPAEDHTGGNEDTYHP
ncbi:hypothetical protein ACQ3I4_05290 [Zafaria sp. Z1313]|uniref:hypothetical protein n=1 Tax=unclassified Zafaria TaxID=2828765 RepID=UPI002E779383|nr:hypothetical protein [Zafaria sp. J156]MEE1621334.1 hypothetical protein [Zafaria sp. J156]